MTLMLLLQYEVEGSSNKSPTQVKLNGDVIFPFFPDANKNQFLVCKELTGCLAKSMTLSNMIIC